MRTKPTILATLWALLITVVLFPSASRGASLPAGFTETEVGSDWNNPVGVAFGKNSGGNKDRAYVWERRGMVWVVENGVKLPTALLDIREEVGNYGDYGLLGFALDPDFQQNGYLYALYVVDRHYLSYYGTAQYNPSTTTTNQATIGRLTRYTCRRSDDFLSVDPASRKVLIGESITTGLPILHTSHGVGSLVFGTDGTLMVTHGDGASFNATDDGGGSGGAYGNQGVTDGIISAAENIGAYRAQMIDSLNGKLLRIDPATGNGVPSNPYYESGNPRSARSRMWAKGLRNACRFALKPGTGSHHAEDGNPGTFYIGDVGYQSWEDLNICDGPGQNFGWPLYEGFVQHPSYWSHRPAGMDAADQKRPAVDWVHNGNIARAMINGTVYNIGGNNSPVAGSAFGGNAACGSLWYTGTDFPEEWRGVYYQADFSGQWVRAFTMNGRNELAMVRPLATGESFVFLTTHPETGGVYYCTVANGSRAGTVRRISYAPGGNRPPSAVASVDRQYGSSPLTVQFSSALSSDPENTALTYSWNFGDGTTSTAANPLKTYTITGARRFDAVLTVKDAGGATATSAVVITVNNTPPVVQITTPAPGTQYPLNQGLLTYHLAASVVDAEHPLASLTHQWQIILVHDNHEHIELVVDADKPTISLDPIGNDPGATYYYRFILRVTDPLGLTTVSERLFMPQTGNAPITANADFFTLSSGSAKMLDVLANDHGAVTDADFSTLQIVTAPAAGAAVVDTLSGRIRYQHNGSGAGSDSFTYRVHTKAGNQSPATTANISITPADTNNMPVAFSDSASTGRGQSVNIPLLANDSDPGGALNPASVAIVSLPVSGTLSLNPQTGAVIYTHNNSALTTDSFIYSVADSQGLRSEPATVKITITAQSGAPVLTNPGGQTSSRGAAVNLPLTVSNPGGQSLTWSASGLPAGLSINTTTGVISGTIGAAATGTTATVTVGNGTLSTSAAFSWSINLPPPPNGLLAEYFDGITPGANPPLLTRNDTSINFDWDVGSPAPSVPVDNFSARWTGELIPLYTESYSFQVAADNGVRVWIDNALVLDRWLPIGTGGSYTFAVNLTAGKHTPFKVEYYEEWGGAGISLSWSSQRQTAEVIPSNAFMPLGAGDSTPPTVSLSGPASTVSGPFNVTATFNEIINGLTADDFTVTNGTAAALNAPGGVWTLTVNPTAAGAVTVALPAGKCLDGGGNGNTASNVFSVNYTPVANRAPVVTSPGNQVSPRGAIVSVQMQGSDPDGQALTWTAAGLPPGLSISSATGLIGGTIPLASAATYNVTVTARDTGGLTGPVSFIWAIGEPLVTGSSGLKGEYFDGITPGSAAPLLTRIDDGINFDWGVDSPGGAVPVDMFSARWTGDLVADYTEKYTFTISGDNGYRLWINNSLVLDNWLPIGTGGTKNVKVNMTAGQRVPIKVEYYEQWGGAGILLWWNSTSTPMSIIPADKFIPPGGVAPEPGNGGTLLPAIANTYTIGVDASGAAVISFNRPLTTNGTATLVESSTDLLTWETVDVPATVSRSAPGTENIRLQVIQPGHLHSEGTAHPGDGVNKAKFYRVRLIEGQ